MDAKSVNSSQLPTAQSEAFKSFVRFMGDVPFAVSDESAGLIEEAERQGIVWISRLDEKKRAENWVLENVVRGRTCLTMGPLEGSFEWHLRHLGAARILAIEGNAANHLKCRTLSAVFPDLRTEFIHGDVMSTVFPAADVVFCPGVLYHLAAPHVLLQKIFDLKPKLVFIATQLAVDAEHPASSFRKLAGTAQLTHAGKSYRGRYFNEGPSRYLAGMDRTQPSVWLYPDDLARLLADIGFHMEDRYEVDLRQLGVCGAYVCSVPGAAAPIPYRFGLRRRITRRIFASLARRMRSKDLVGRPALRG